MKAARAGHMDTVRFLVERGEDRHTDTRGGGGGLIGFEQCGRCTVCVYP